MQAFNMITKQDISSGPYKIRGDIHFKEYSANVHIDVDNSRVEDYKYQAIVISANQAFLQFGTCYFCVHEPHHSNVVDKLASKRLKQHGQNFMTHLLFHLCALVDEFKSFHAWQAMEKKNNQEEEAMEVDEYERRRETMLESEYLQFHQSTSVESATLAGEPSAHDELEVAVDESTNLVSRNQLYNTAEYGVHSCLDGVCLHHSICQGVHLLDFVNHLICIHRLPLKRRNNRGSGHMTKEQATFVSVEELFQYTSQNPSAENTPDGSGSDTDIGGDTDIPTYRHPWRQWYSSTEGSFYSKEDRSSNIQHKRRRGNWSTSQEESRSR